jgi:hypothetical protein
VTRGLGVLLGQHTVGKRGCVCQTLQCNIHVVGVPQVLHPITTNIRLLPSKIEFLLGNPVCCQDSLMVINFSIFSMWHHRGYRSKTPKRTLATG